MLKSATYKYTLGGGLVGAIAGAAMTKLLEDEDKKASLKDYLVGTAIGGGLGLMGGGLIDLSTTDDTEDGTDKGESQAQNKTKTGNGDGNDKTSLDDAVENIRNQANDAAKRAKAKDKELWKAFKGFGTNLAFTGGSGTLSFIFGRKAAKAFNAAYRQSMANRTAIFDKAQTRVAQRAENISTKHKSEPAHTKQQFNPHTDSIETVIIKPAKPGVSPKLVAKQQQKAEGLINRGRGTRSKIQATADALTDPAFVRNLAAAAVSTSLLVPAARGTYDSLIELGNQSE